MNFSRNIGTFAALALIGAGLGYYLSTQRPWPLGEDAERQSAAASEFAPPKLADSSVVGEPAIEPPALAPVNYPRGAVAGELVVRFESRQDYLAYLEALADAGIAPLGQIDALLAVRISEAAGAQINYRRYGAQGNFSYKVERPLPPVQVSPEALASLTSFGMPANAITGDTVGGSGAGVQVAILDSGIQSLEQFDELDITELDLTGEGIGGEGAGHGTSVASIIAGSQGIAPQVELFVVRVLDDDGLGNSYHVAEGIVQAVDRGIDIINLSLGVYQDTPLLRQAVNYASTRGVLLVAAAGNDAYTQLPYPAAYTEVLAVTAVDATGQYAYFPNQSTEIDFAAPGVGVLTWNEDEGSVLFSGTSAAAPFVTGTLACLLSGDEALAPQQAVALLQTYLNDRGAPGVDPVYGAGVIDWDRIRERNTSGIHDLALADIYLPADALPGTTMPLEVSVQNRGTAWSGTAELEIYIGEAEPVTFTLGSLAPGQVTARKVFTQMPAAGSEHTLRLGARVTTEHVNEDVRLQNNTKAVAFRPPES
jgi:subtilisin family serine protease